ncbi:TPA: PAS domain-containing protein, partial [Aeromonas veronii]
MEMLKTPLVDVTARLDPGLLSDAMALLEAGIWSWSAQHGLQRDPSCLRLLGLGECWPDDLGWLDRVHPDDVARLEDALLACQSGRSSGLRLEYRILHHHGHYIRLEERMRRDERGYLLGVVRHLDPAAVLVEERHGTDPLTGLESRGRFEQLLEERLATESGTF